MKKIFVAGLSSILIVGPNSIFAEDSLLDSRLFMGGSSVLYKECPDGSIRSYPSSYATAFEVEGHTLCKKKDPNDWAASKVSYENRRTDDVTPKSE